MFKYKAHFSYLICYSPKLVLTDKHQSMMIKQGLNDFIHAHILSLAFPSYQELMEATKILDHDENLVEA